MKHAPAARRRRWTDRKSTRLNSSHTEIYTLSLHDALPIFETHRRLRDLREARQRNVEVTAAHEARAGSAKATVDRSEEHTSELQSHRDLHSFPTRRSSDLRNAPTPSRSARSSSAERRGHRRA